MSETGDEVRTRTAEGASGLLWWDRRRSAVLDVTLALLSMVECAFEGRAFAGEADIPVAAGIALGLVVGSTLVLRRRFPIAVVLITIAIIPAEMGFLLSLVGLYTLAASDVPRRIIALLTGMQLVGGLIVVYLDLRSDVGPQLSSDWFVFFAAATLTLSTVVPPALLGMYVGARRRLVEALRERTDGLERELLLLAERAEERAEWARGEERARIAREMHDVVAHRVSLMVVHAAALQAVALKDPEKASRNAALVGDMGRQALTELRTMLGVLRSADGLSAVGATAATPAAAERPLAKVAEYAAAAAQRESTAAAGPRLGELEQLVEQSRAAGMRVELSVEGEVCGFAAVVEQTAFRVVQEALTNVHKHAGGARTRVRLAYRGTEVAVQVENESPVSAADSGLPSGGNGLLGMKERVTALGGGFVSGPTDSGGFRVSAVIPDVTDAGTDA
ncbi:histidine kinase [Streptomyces sp. XM4193]|uniref:sensor histidine kinase n=1 Tax=Streptomyces sp. XM4193 TaxID=2929782 RepID=UPI001FF91ECF|nr:histidine kinase [Streptomyces sp. XM4193]MCK1796853.1 histidine kinase [Streptomyces sp. XM4193]